MTQLKEIATKIDTWAIVELMGHVRIAGRVTEEEHFGAKLGRIDIPTGDGFVTQFFGGSSVYRMTPCSEAAARGVAAANVPQPVHSWELPALPQYDDEDSVIDAYDQSGDPDNEPF